MMMASELVDINDDDCLLRLISEKHVNECKDKDGNGSWRLTTAMFQCSSLSDGESRSTMSVNIKKLIEEAKLNPRTFMISGSYVGVISFSAGNVRKEGMEAIHDPIADNRYHGGVFSTKRSDGRLSGSQKSYLTRIANLLTGPEGYKSKDA